MSEIAPKKVRGAVVAGYQFCITIGILLANCVVYGTQNRRDTGSYRIPIAVQFLWAIILATGLNFIFYFGTVFFQQLGSISNPFMISLVTTLVNVLSTPASFVMVEKIGRRRILIWGAAGMVVMQFIVGAIGATAGKNTPDHP